MAVVQLGCRAEHPQALAVMQQIPLARQNIRTEVSGRTTPVKDGSTDLSLKVQFNTTWELNPLNKANL